MQALTRPIPLGFQETPIKELTEVLKTSSALLLGAPGVGKTFIFCDALDQYCKDFADSFSKEKLCNILILSPKSTLTQHRRILNRYGITVNVMVRSYGMIRSTLGEAFIKWITRVVGNDIEYDPVWYKDEMPDIIIADEIQNAKNHLSLTSKILQAYVEQGGKLLAVSATPFQKANETKVLATALGSCQCKSWKDWADVVSNYDPTANSPTVTKRILDEWTQLGKVVKVKYARFKCKAINRTMTYDFEVAQDRKIYDLAFENYLEKLRKAGREPCKDSRMLAMVALAKFCEVAEFLHNKKMTEIAIDRVNNGRQVLIVGKYLNTLKKVWSNLMKVGVNKNDIGYLVGSVTDKQRQIFIDRFQDGTLPYLLLSIKTGGAGLSLPNEDDKNKPRSVVLPFTWSGFDMFQVLYRAHRVTSISQTDQTILAFNDTVEANEVIPRLSSKIDCLKELLERKDQFMLDIFQKAVGIKIDSLALEEGGEDKGTNTEEEDEDELTTEMLDEMISVN